MTGLDTNVLVRFFAMDHPVQSYRARTVMSSLSATDPGWVGIVTILELVWVMKSAMRLDRTQIANAIDSLLAGDAIVVERAEIVEKALRLYRRGKAEFADCMIASSALAAGCTKTVTFDRIAARDAGIELIA